MWAWPRAVMATSVSALCHWRRWLMQTIWCRSLPRAVSCCCNHGVSTRCIISMRVWVSLGGDGWCRVMYVDIGAIR